MLRINKENYVFYKQIFTLIWEFVSKHTLLETHSKDSPVTGLTYLETQNQSLAPKGLQQAFGDMQTWIKDLPEDTQKQLNLKLISQGFPSLSYLTAFIRKLPHKVMKREQINSTEEYYLIKEFLDDLENGLSEGERKKLGKILSQFEEAYC